MMSKNLFAWLTPSVDDPDLARQQRLLNLVLLALAGPGFLFGLVTAGMWALGRAPITGALAGLGVQPFYLAAYWLGRRGRVRWAGYLPTTVIFLIMAGANYQLGVGHAILIGYAMVTLTAGLLIGSGAALFFALLSMGACLAVGAAQAAGRVPTPLPPETTVVADSIAVGLGLIVLVIFNWFSNREASRMVRRERELSAELRAYHEELERRVAERTAELASVNEQLENRIAERKRAEEALRESEERYRLHFENVTDVIYSVDLESRVLSISPSVERVLGYTPEELVGKRFPELNILAPECLEDAFSDMMRVLAGEHVASSVYEFIAKDGTKRIGEVSGAPLIRDGEVVGVVSVARDVTERKQAEEKLRESEAKFRALAETAPAAIFIYQDTGFRYVNPTAQALTGYSAEELLAMSFWDVVHPDSRDLVKTRGLARQKGEPAPPRYEFKIVTKRGQERWVDFAASRIEFEGQPAAIGTAYDITDRKRAEEEARRRATQAALIYEVGQRVSGELELDTLLSKIVTAVCDTFDYYGAMLTLLDEETGRLTLRSIAGGYADFFPDDLWLAVGEGMVGHAAATGETQVSGDVSKNPYYVRKAEEETKSELAVPIKSGQRVIGVLDIQSNEFDAFDESDVVAMETLSSQIGAAIENAHLLQDTRVRAEELDVLNDLGQALTIRLDVDHVLEETYHGVSRLMDTTDFYIALYRPGEEEITFALDVIAGEMQRPYVTRRAGRGLAERVTHTRAPLLIRENLPQALEEMGIELGRRPALSWVGVPLIVGDRVLGMMAAVQSRADSPAYDEHDRDLLHAVASQTAIALQNARLFEETRRRVTQLALINDIAEKIAAVLDLESVLKRAARLVQEGFGYHHVGLFTMGRERGELVMRARAGDFAHLFSPDHRLKLGQGMVGWAGRHNETLLANDVDAEPRYVNLYPGAMPTRSELCVPIGIGGEVVGVLDVQSPQRDAFDENDVLVLETLADQIAVAIENARLYEAVQQELAERKQAQEALRQRNRELATLYEATASISSDLSLEVVLQTVAEQMTRALGASGCALSLWDRERGVVETLIDLSASFPGEGDRRGAHYHLDDYPATRAVLETGQPVIVQRDDATADGAELALMERDEVYTLLMVPLITRDRALGLAELVHEVERGDYTPDQLRLARSLAAQAAVAIENGRLYEETARQLAQTEVLREMMLAVASTLDFDQVLARTIDVLGRALRVEYLGFMLPDEGGALMKSHPSMLGYAPSEGVFRFPTDQCVTGRVYRTGQPVILADVREAVGYAIAEGEVRSGLAVPVKVGDEVVAVLNLESSQPDAFGEEDLTFYTAVAGQLGVAMENARLFQAGQRRLQELQALYDTALGLTSQRDLGLLLKEIVRRAVGLLGAETGGIYLVDRGREVLRLTACHGYAEEYIGVTLRPGEGMAGRVFLSGEPLIVDDYRTWEGRAAVYEADQPFTAVLEVPLKWQEEVIGVLALDADSAVETFTQADMELATLFAQQAAIAIQNARLYEEARQRSLEQETLREAVLALTTTLKWGEVVERVLAQLQRVVDYDTASIQLLRCEQDEEWLEIVGGRGFPNLEEIVGLTFDPSREDNPNREVIRTRAPFIVGDAPQVYQEFRRDPHAPAGIRSWLGVPMLVGERLIGMIVLDKSEPGFYTPQHGRLAETFAAQAAIAMENARLHEEILDHAERLEQRVQERTAQLAAERARLEATLHSASDGIVVTDSAGDIVQANPVAQAWLTQTLAPEEAARLREAVRSVAARAEERPTELLELAGLDLEVNAAPISETGSEAAAVIAIHDVSHLKSLDRMKNRFVTNISHELRTPITTIKLYAHLMRQRPDKWEHYLETLAREADHQAHLVEDILEISRLDSGRSEMRPRPTPLDELTGAVVSSRREQAQERGLALEYRPAEPGPVALIDPDRMMQALGNLVENGIRHTPEGGRVTLSTAKQEADGRAWATVTIADTGMGIPGEELPHIFERFFRGAKPREMQLSGTGLGLSIVKEIVELHGGWVTVESEEGVGSTFVVWLPLAE